MGIVIGILLGVISCSLVYKNNGMWYEYLAAIILTVFAYFGLMIMIIYYNTLSKV